MVKKEKKKLPITHLRWALFSKYDFFHRPKIFLKDIKIYFNRRRFVLKHGYAEVGNWETGEWFIDVMKQIITNYRDHRTGTPMIIQDFDLDNQEKSISDNEKCFDDLCDKMLQLLEKMGDSYYWDGNDWDPEQDRKQEEAKDEFMKLFSKYFYTLWN